MSEMNKVIGYEEIKTELYRIIDMIRNSAKYRELGVSAPKGILLEGEPGIGKTLMAKSFIMDSRLKSIDDIGGGKFRYLIAGKYTGGDVPEGMVVYEFPRGEWAVFNCIGPNPETLQRVNTQIFREWLPGNPDYELCGNATVEWYDCVNGEMTDPDYHSAIWIPVRKRHQG